MTHFERLKLPENEAFLELFNHAEFLCFAIKDVDTEHEKTACSDLKKALLYLNGAIMDIRKHKG